MSDLAPFVAAVLKDKATADLLQENDELRFALRTSRVVTVTGPGGTPVYAEGQFEEGRHAYNPNLWEVDLRATGVTCPLVDLLNIAIRLGVCKASLVNGDHEGFADGAYDKHERTGPVSIFIQGSGRLWLTVLVAPFTSAAANSEIASMDGDGMVSFLSEDLDAANTMSAKFSSVDFVIKSVSGAIDNLNLDLAVLEGAGRRREVLSERNAEQAAEGNNDDGIDDDEMEEHADEQAEASSLAGDDDDGCRNGRACR
jgi:hypothetical protein